MTVVVFAALVFQVSDFAKELLDWPRSWRAVVMQALAWLVGVLAAFVGHSAVLTKAIVIPGTDRALGTLDAPSLVLAGLLIASVASTAYDLKAAIDNRDSAAKPPLLAGVGTPPPAA